MSELKKKKKDARILDHENFHRACKVKRKMKTLLRVVGMHS